MRANISSPPRWQATLHREPASAPGRSGTGTRSSRYAIWSGRSSGCSTATPIPAAVGKPSRPTARPDLSALRGNLSDREADRAEHGADEFLHLRRIARSARELLIEQEVRKPVHQR